MRGQGLIAAAIKAGAPDAKVAFRNVKGWKFLVLLCWDPYDTGSQLTINTGGWDVCAVYPDITTAMENVAGDVENWKLQCEAKRNRESR